MKIKFLVMFLIDIDKFGEIFDCSFIISLIVLAKTTGTNTMESTKINVHLTMIALF